jgi:4'-phosphopantetheinyl transferase
LISWCLHRGSGADEPDLADLAPAELAVLEGLRVPKRRADWLLGRAAVKRLCCAHLAAAGHRLAPVELRVGSAADGAPEVRGPDGELLPLTVSLSHSGGVAVAALWPAPGAPLGIDVELCEERASGFAEDFFTSAEVEVVRAAGPARAARVTTEVWSLKEAALKALRVGLRADTRSVEVRPRPEPSLGWGEARVLTPRAKGATAFALDLERFVITVVWLGEHATGAPVAGVEPS